ncbi:MAG: ATP-binding cassette domain-containing protein [Alicyclobacillus sp.]|nr:ATP-binding cassette domain-containing protein [Alicyclobacillus sp.]
MLEVTNLQVQFLIDDTYHSAVEDVSFVIEKGETLGLVGESGCGKSVTSLALMRLLPKTARIGGSIRYEGVDLLSLPDRQMRDIRGNQISMIFQEPMTSLNPVQKIGVQVMEVLLLHERHFEGRQDVHVPPSEGHQVCER